MGSQTRRSFRSNYTYTSLGYKLGFWSAEYAVRDCTFVVPYCSGYGGIRYVLNPNGVVYFYVSDSETFSQEAEILEMDKMHPQC